MTSRARCTGGGPAAAFIYWDENARSPWEGRREISLLAAGLIQNDSRAPRVGSWGLVGVEAAAGLAAQIAGLHQVFEKGGRAEFRLAELCMQ